MTAGEAIEAVRDRVALGSKPSDEIDYVLAAAVEAARVTLGIDVHDVQIAAAVALAHGHVVEMATGEGKTLSACFAAVAASLDGTQVHVLTANDYLACRDADWMAPVFEMLGVEVGCAAGLGQDEDDRRREMYARPVCYATVPTVGFDYLRDNMRLRREDQVLRAFGMAIIDEADSILVDDARVPLVLSGPSDVPLDLYVKVDAAVAELEDADVAVDHLTRTAVLTDAGDEHLETILREKGLLQGEGLYDGANVRIVHHALMSLKAHRLLEAERDYVVANGEIVVVDETTGRFVDGRRWSDGLHQAVEAKERVAIRPESQSYAGISFQNLVLLYRYRAGMTGTASAESDEFRRTYGMTVAAIPSHRPCRRIDEADEVYRSRAGKLRAVVREILASKERGQPVLVGTTSIAKSDELAAMLCGHGFEIVDLARDDAFEPLRADPAARVVAVLNAKHHEHEARILADAGLPGAVTIATNMAGRGVDIRLGGADGDPHLAAAAEAAGGLYVIGTERHESRRVDDQLRGRSGRQGNPGRSRFVLSLEDDLLRLFGAKGLDRFLSRAGFGDDDAISHRFVNGLILNAQKKVDGRNGEQRREVKRYDDVLAGQRTAFYDLRMRAVDGAAEEIARDLVERAVEVLASIHAPEDVAPDDRDVAAMAQDFRMRLGIPVRPDLLRESGKVIVDAALAAMAAKRAEKIARAGEQVYAELELYVVVSSLDIAWRNHVAALDHLRSVVSLRAYGGRDPLTEFRTEAVEMYEALLEAAALSAATGLSFASVKPQAAAA
ncbi:preprotein translocase subunit SecA [Methylobacterium hispanicum]|nr:DEAD/DEAH box helicase [Methylobacterium hispanicum]